MTMPLMKCGVRSAECGIDCPKLPVLGMACRPFRERSDWSGISVCPNPQSAILNPQLSSRSGLTLIGIIAAIVVMGLLGAGVLMLVSTGSRESIQTLNWGKSFFAAESGISAARAYMATNSISTNISGAVGQASFTATIDADGRITSVGSKDEAQWTSIYGGAEAARISSAMIVYHENTGYWAHHYPRYRFYSGQGMLSEELNAQPVNHALKWQRISSSSKNGEFLLGLQNNGPKIWAQTYAYTNQISNGTWFANMQLDANGPPGNNMRGFDVAHENSSGRGMVVYSIGTQYPQYRTWSSGHWSAPNAITNLGAEGAIYWVRLVSRPGTDEIMCLARWTEKHKGNFSSAVVWNGATWINPAVLESACSSEINYETFDATYSANRAMVVYINGADQAARRIPKYKTYDAVLGAWSAEQSIWSLGGNGDNNQPKWIRVEYSPDGTMAYAGLILKVNAPLRGTLWNGSVWSDYYNFGGVKLQTGLQRAFDIAWSSQTNTLMVVYSTSADSQSYMLTTSAGSAGSLTNFGSLVATDPAYWCVLKPDPCTADFYCQTLGKKTVNFQRWNGSTWSLFPELETESDFSYLTIDFSFRKDSAAKP